jgi:hypothetical protein
MLASPLSFGERLANRIALAPLRIEQAKPEEMGELGLFRYRIYVEQVGKDAAHADHANRTLLEPLDATSVNLIARNADGIMVGAVRISRASDGWRLPEQCHQDPWPWVPPHRIACVSRLMVDREIAPRLATPALFADCFRWGLTNSVRLCAVFCGPALRSLFESYGCQQFDETYPDRFVGAQVPMLCCLHDRTHLSAIGSPFANLGNQDGADRRDLAYIRSIRDRHFNNQV